MSAAELIRDIHRHGGDVTVDGDDLNLTATQPLSPDLLHQLRTQKVDLLAYLNAEADNTKAEPASACPDCGSGQYWQLPYQPWRCWWCMPNKPLTATTLTLPCHKAPAPPAGAQDVPDTLFETVCEGLSITRRTLRAELIDDDLSELTAPGLRQVAETLAAAPNQYEREASARLAQHPELTHAFVTTDDDDPEFVHVVVAIRDTATCELRIPRQQYAGLAMLEWIDEHISGGQK